MTPEEFFRKLGKVRRLEWHLERRTDKLRVGDIQFIEYVNLTRELQEYAKQMTFSELVRIHEYVRDNADRLRSIL